MDLTPPKNNLHDILNDPTIPNWKKDLIVRKRNTNRLLFGNLKFSCPTTINSPTSSTSSALSEAIRNADEELHENQIAAADECSNVHTYSMKSPTSPTSSETSLADIIYNSEDDTVLNNKSSTAAVVEDFHLTKNNVTSSPSSSTTEKVNGEGNNLVVGNSSSNSNISANFNIEKNDDPTVYKSASNSEHHSVLNIEMRLENSNNINNSSDNNNIISNNNNKKTKIKNKRVNVKMGEEKVKMKSSSRKLSTPNSSSTVKEISLLDSNEEIKYGPGIVHKLRDRYINITLREAASNYNKRPPLSSMRRASSLDNILDDLPARKNKTSVTETTQPPPVNNITHPTKYITTNKKRNENNMKYNNHTSSVLNSKQESLKRVRSMETLLIFDGKSNNTSPGLVNEDIVIIEQSKPIVNITRKRTSSGSVPSEDEMPPPDVVRQTRQKFERKNVNSSSSTLPARLKKPALSPKPIFDTSTKTIQKENKPTKNVMPNPPPLPLPAQKYILEKKLSTSKITSPEKTKSTVEKVNSPTSETTTKVVTNSVIKTEVVTPKVLPPALSPTKPIPPTLTPITKPISPVLSPTKPISPTSPTKSITPTKPSSPTSPTKTMSPTKIPLPKSPSPPMVNGNKDEKDEIEENTKIISQKALENIRRNGLSFEINPKSSPNLPSHLPGSRSPSPQVISVQQKINDKQVGIIRPIPKTIENNRTNEKNLINSVKNEKPTIIPSPTLKTDKNNSSYVSPPNFSKPQPPPTKIETPILRPTPSPSPPNVKQESMGGGNSELWGANKRPYNDQSCTISFDFTSKKIPVPDYIENDGVIIRRTTSSSGGVQSSEDLTDTTGPPSPVRNVEVIGGNVLINGRSNLQKNPKTNKLRIKFDDGATSTFEYPSEASLLLDEALPGAPQSAMSPAGDVTTPRASLQPLPSGSGSLASYTPSKILMTEETFELGVTRAAAATAPILYLADTEQDESSDFLLTPAQGEDTVAWSSETASDLLF